MITKSAFFVLIFSSVLNAQEIIPPGTTRIRSNALGGYTYANRNSVLSKSKPNALGGYTYSNRGKVQAKSNSTGRVYSPSRSSKK